MPPLQTRVSHLVRWGLKKGGLYVRALAPDLSDLTQRRVGLVLGVIKAELPPRVGDALAAHIEDSLIRGLAEAIRRLPTDASQETIFESAVTRINEALARVTNDQRLPIGPGGIDGVLLAQKEGEITAAVWGLPSVLLFHPAKTGKVGIFDLLQEDRPAAKPGKKEGGGGQGFMHIISGRIGQGDKMLISTDDLRPMLGAEELAPLVSDNDPEAATAILRDVLAARKEAGHLALFVTDVAEEEYYDDEIGGRPSRRLSSATQRSIEKLLSTESRTANIMSSSLPLNLARGLGSALAGGWRKMAGGDKAEEEAVGAEEGAALAEGEEAPVPEPESAPPEENIEGNETIDEVPEELPEDIEAEPPEEPEIPEEMPVETEPEPAPPAEVPVAAPRPQGPGAAAIIGQAARRAAAALGTGLSVLFSKEKRRAAKAAAGQRTDSFLTKAIAYVNGLSTVGKACLLTALLLIIVFNHSLVFAGWQKRQQEAAAAYDRSVAAIEQKIDSAEASLIYHDEDRARTLLAEATTLIAELPQGTDDQKRLSESLTKKVEVKYAGTRRVVELAPPDVAASITDGEGAVILSRLTGSADVVWSASTTGKLFRTALKDGTTIGAGAVPGGRKPGIFLMSGNGTLAGNEAGSDLVAADPAGKTAARPIDMAGNQAEIADADTYADRLYLLDAKHNRIIRLNPVKNGYGQPQFYLKDATDVSTAVSLAIDGSVWVLLRNGGIVKLIKGVRSELPAARIEPAPVAPLKIRASAGSDHLYFLDASSPARVICLDKKTGQLVAQYVSASLDGATDFLVDEKGHTLLAAVGNRLLRFALPEQK